MSKFNITILVIFTLLAFISCHPFTNCGSSTDPLKVISFDLTPDPPKAGSNLTISASAILNEAVTSGTYTLIVDYIGIQVLTKTEDLCKFLTCPIPANQQLNGGETVLIPSSAPSGSYSGTVQFYDQDKNKLGCVGFTMNL